MKKYLFLLVLFLTASVAKAQDSLHVKLDSLLQHPMFQTSQVALMVYDLRADTAIYQYNARQLMRPASTMKLITAITALDHLGGDYQLSTRLYTMGTIEEGQLQEDLYCVGGFDPMLTDDDVHAFAQTLHESGILVLKGSVLTDRSMKEPLDYGEGWCWDDDNPTRCSARVSTSLMLRRAKGAVPTGPCSWQYVSIASTSCCCA